MLTQNTDRLQIWGGVECTLNRVGDRYFSQLQWNGHAHREADLELFADLGFSAMRYPVLWEMVAPHSPEDCDWRFPDARLSQLRAMNIEPIVGLCHHGSGPHYAPIDSPDFAPGLEQFALQVARRFPEISAYTPINEPLTTARFCGLYGHWFPHGSSDASFARVLFNECAATVRAMRAIRSINPAAQLVQTEDLGRIFSTPALHDQARFENDRRWLAFDLISGRVTPNHSLWGYLLWAGIGKSELEWIGENATSIAFIGINYYPTSDRFLDEKWERYPASTHGSNGRQKYADLEAVRVLAHPVCGFQARIREAWDRYHIPLAVTEAHLGCTREEQMRWLHDAFCAMQTLKKEGVDARALTVWSLLGAFNWNTLVTKDTGFYEPGVFDVRSGTPRPTAIARLLRELPHYTDQNQRHPALHQPGWWNRAHRLIYPVAFTQHPEGQQHGALEEIAVPPTRSWRLVPPDPFHCGQETRDKSSRPLAILGATGTLGQALARACETRGLTYYLLGRREMDLCDPMTIEATLDAANPWLVINATGYVRVDDAESEDESALCNRVNHIGAVHLAKACARRGLPLVCFSSDLVFDGKNRQTPYMESDSTSPLNIYGRSKNDMEIGVLQEHPHALVTRTSAFFGPHDNWNFITVALRTLQNGETFRAANDLLISPTYVPHLADTTLDLALDGESGLRHLACQGTISWFELAKKAAHLMGISTQKLVPVEHKEFGWRAARPRFCALGSEYGTLLPDIQTCLETYKNQLKI